MGFGLMGTKWDREKKKGELVRMPEYAVYMSEDHNKPIVCASCAQPMIYGEGYGSLELFNENGVWSFIVCGDCYAKEWKREREYIKKHSEQ